MVLGEGGGARTHTRRTLATAASMLAVVVRKAGRGSVTVCACVCVCAWGRHKDRVHTRLAGHREGGREFKNKRFTVVALAQETSRRQRQDAVLEGGTSMRRRTEKAISMNTRNRRISRLTFAGGSA